MNEPRFWIDDSLSYDFIPAEYVGLVDEEKGGIIAYGAYPNILDLAQLLNTLMPKKYNHAMTLAYVVISENPEMPTVEECMDALRKRMVQLETDEGERIEALTTDLPFDTFEFIEQIEGSKPH